MRGRAREGGGGKLSARRKRALQTHEARSHRARVEQLANAKHASSFVFHGHPPPCPSPARGEGTLKQRSEPAAQIEAHVSNYTNLPFRHVRQPSAPQMRTTLLPSELIAHSIRRANSPVMR